MCTLCNLRCKSLKKHLREVHKLSVADYGGQVLCDNSRHAYSEQNKENSNWINREQEKGNDLKEYREKMGKSVSKAILSSPKERQRRSDLLKELNKTKIWTPEFKAMMTEKSKKTAARPEIIAKRTEQLKKWRDENFEDFYEKCVKNFSISWRSKPELALFELVKMIDGYTFMNNQFIKDETFMSKTKRKQVDIADVNMGVYLEFDGPWHFQNINGSLQENIARDKLFDEYIERNQLKLIRISHDQYSYGKGGSFKEECLKQLFDALKDPKPGVVKIGKAYDAQ